MIAAGGYTLAYLSDEPAIVAILACFGVVVALTLVLERVAFRPLRGTSPATMLVATFAISFLLRSIYLVAFGSRGEIVGTLGGLNTAVAIGSLRIRWISIVALVVGALLLLGTTMLLNRTTIGLHIRAAAADFRTARIIGVRANGVIVFSFVISALLAAAVAVLLTVQTPLVTPDFGVQVTIFALVGVVVGGLDRLLTATLGGFAIGFTTSFLGAQLPTSSSAYLPSMVYGLVILVLLLRPGGLFARGSTTAAERV
jgi:branched-chain amino acid transport system permease protein